MSATAAEWIVVIACSCGVACGKCSGGADATPDAHGATPRQQTSRAGAGHAPGSEREGGWADAWGGDPLELARLADAVGVHALIDVADDASASPDDRATAIRAIAFVDDPSPALPSLGRTVRDTSIERSTLALQTLAAVAPRRAPLEETEPGAWRPCATTLLEALVTLKDPVRRELAIRALLAMADRGAVDRSSVPVR